MKTFIGQKLTMSQTWDDQGKRLAVTAVKIEPMTILRTISPEKNGYRAVQVGIIKQVKPKKNMSYRVVREIATSEKEVYEAGTQIGVEGILNQGDWVAVSGWSRGKGFAGGVKRHGFKGGPKTHGQSDRHRAPGSIGQGTTPGRIHKGKRMAGHMGVEKSTIKNLQVVKIDPEKNELWVSGPVPGVRGGILMISKLRGSKSE